MPNIRARTNKDGKIVSYEIRVHRGRDADGKQLKPYTTTYKPREGMTEKQITKELNRIATLFEEECRNGLASTEQKTFSEYASYVIDLKEQSGLKHSTALSYKEKLERINDENLSGFGFMKLKNIRPEHLNKFYIALSKEGVNKKTGTGLSPKTILEHHRFISVVLENAFKEQLVPFNTAQRAMPPKQRKKEAECFELEEVTAIIDAVENEPIKWKALTHLFITTGARRGELLGLHWKDVNFDDNSIYLCNNLLYSPDRGTYCTTLKTGENRRVSISEEVLKMLRHLKTEQSKEQLQIGSKSVASGFVFTQWNGAPMHPDSVTDYFNKLSERFNLPHINPHKFRHTQASLLINSGVDIVAVSKRLGHAKVSTTTDIYAHIINKADERASDTISALLYKKCSAQ